MKDDLNNKASSDPLDREAVALGFDGHNAPKVTAKGTGIVADEIIALAKEAGVHIHKNAHLSNFLQRLELGDEIPKELYLLIAELIEIGSASCRERV